MAFIRDFPSSGFLRLAGKDRVRFLQGMLTADVAKLTAGQGCRAAMLTPKGKLIGELIVLCRQSEIDLVLDGALVARVYGEMDRHLIADDVQIEDRSALDAQLGVYGADAASLVERSFGRTPPVEAYAFVDEGKLASEGERDGAGVGALVGQGVCLVRSPDLAMPGVRVLGSVAALAAARARLVAAGASATDETTWEVLRVEAGRPRWGADMGEDRMPVEARLDDAISYTKGCYVGQETIVRLRDQGHLNWRLMGLRLDGDGAVAAGSRVSIATRPEAGTVTSSVVSPRLGALALAYLHRSAMTPGTTLTVHDGATDRIATVSDLPFTVEGV